MFDTTASIFAAASFSQTPKIDLPEIKNPWQALSYKGLEHLLQEYANGFSATKHVMPFPREVFQVDKDFQEGDVFQRALILDTLLDFNPNLQNQLNNIIDAEAGYLFNARRKTGIGGWAYFPELRELPPDADDLAQVMQVLLRAGYSKTATPHFELALNVLLNDQANADNGWESWIIPKSDQTEEQQLQTIWVNKAWGTGSDIEVVANLVYAFILFDNKRFAAAIERGLTFLLNSHKNSHCWESTWYYGDYYGTYVSLRAICAANGPKSTIEGAVTFIENNRQPDGSWTERQESSPLQTALALQALSIGKKHLGLIIDEQWLQSSLSYLQQTCDANDNWPSSPFIRMPMGRPMGFVHTILTYESAAITSNYVAKACNHLYQNHINQN